MNLMPPGLIIVWPCVKIVKECDINCIPGTVEHWVNRNSKIIVCNYGEGAEKTAMKYLNRQVEASDGLIILTLSLGSIIITLDLGIMYISFSAIMNDLNVPLSVASWAGTSYLIVVAVLSTVIGRIGDRQGLKKTFIRSMGIFVFASLLCALSWDIFSLIGARIIQALGGSMIVMAGPALVASLIPYSSQGRSQGYLTAAAAIGNAIGFGLGGIIISNLGWRWMFLINILIGISGLLFGKVYADRADNQTR
jgi:MFS family permease